MSSRPWTVLASHHSPGADRCVDIFVRLDGTFGFEEFRQDPEDMGAWSVIGSFSGATFATADEALTAAYGRVAWLRAGR